MKNRFQSQEFYEFFKKVMIATKMLKKHKMTKLPNVSACRLFGMLCLKSRMLSGEDQQAEHSDVLPRFPIKNFDFEVIDFYLTQKIKARYGI